MTQTTLEAVKVVEKKEYGFYLANFQFRKIVKIRNSYVIDERMLGIG